MPLWPILNGCRSVFLVFAGSHQQSGHARPIAFALFVPACMRPSDWELFGDEHVEA